MLIENATIQQVIDELQKAEDKSKRVFIRNHWSDGEWTNDIDITIMKDGDVEIE